MSGELRASEIARQVELLIDARHIVTVMPYEIVVDIQPVVLATLKVLQANFFIDLAPTTGEEE